jgi:hypothetical protein
VLLESGKERDAFEDVNWANAGAASNISIIGATVLKDRITFLNFNGLSSRKHSAQQELVDGTRCGKRLACGHHALECRTAGKANSKDTLNPQASK